LYTLKTDLLARKCNLIMIDGKPPNAKVIQNITLADAGLAIIGTEEPDEVAAIIDEEGETEEIETTMSFLRDEIDLDCDILETIEEELYNKTSEVIASIEGYQIAVEE
jgi:hypothetical protein